MVLGGEIVKDVKVLGPGCPKCEELMKQTQTAVLELGLECSVEKITDIQEITIVDHDGRKGSGGALT